VDFVCWLYKVSPQTLYKYIILIKTAELFAINKSSLFVDLGHSPSDTDLHSIIAHTIKPTCDNELKPTEN
jgi:hypothetical protein